MAKKIKQFRYYGEGHSNNQPTNISSAASANEPVSYQNYVSGEVFASCFPILQLGVQSLPGTRFYLNSGIEPIIIGITGIYELDLNGQTEITNLQFDVNSMRAINNNSNASLIVDVIYEGMEE